jgi:dTDP-4-amino-4,6-dideoxygalactose transaminase
MEAGFGKTPLPKTERAAGTVLSMPVNPLVTKEDIVKMAEITKKSQ